MLDFLSLPLITQTPQQALVFLLCVFLAGIIRGCIGFGFSALLVASTSLYVSPLLVVPLLILLEIVASIHLLMSTYKDALWKPLLFMGLGSVVGIPIGLAILSLSPQQLLEFIVSFIILVMTLALLTGFTYRRRLSTFILLCVGAVAGVFGGVAAAGGLVVASFLSSAAFPVKNIRATMVIFIFITTIIFLLSATVTEVYNERVFNTFLLACAPMFLGIVFGIKLFKRLDEKKLRLLTLMLLSTLSIIGLAKAL